MSDDTSPYKHDASDKRLDKSAKIDEARSDDGSDAASPTHDPEHIREHSDRGKDRMFEGREQHDEYRMKQEKTRLSKDQERHGHPTEGEDAVTESNMHVKRKH